MGNIHYTNTYIKYSNMFNTYLENTNGDSLSYFLCFVLNCSRVINFLNQINIKLVKFESFCQKLHIIMILLCELVYMY